MTLHISPEMLEAAYLLIKTAPPFKRWKLPHPDHVEFRVTRDKDCYGWHQELDEDHHVIAISALRVGHLSTLLETMAHEMVHMHVGGTHGKEFSKAARQAAKNCGFDPRAL